MKSSWANSASNKAEHYGTGASLAVHREPTKQSKAMTMFDVQDYTKAERRGCWREACIIAVDLAGNCRDWVDAAKRALWRIPRQEPGRRELHRLVQEAESKAIQLN